MRNAIPSLTMMQVIKFCRIPRYICVPVNQSLRSFDLFTSFEHGEIKCQRNDTFAMSICVLIYMHMYTVYDNGYQVHDYFIVSSFSFHVYNLCCFVFILISQEVNNEDSNT